MGQLARRALQTVAIIVLIILIVICAWHSTDKLRSQEEDLAVSHLQARTELTANAVSENIAGIENFLQTLASEYEFLVDKGYSVEECVSLFKTVNDVDSFKRLGVSLPDGTSYSTDGYITNLANEDGFAQTLQGYFTISDTIVDTFTPDGDPIHVFRYPVVKDGEVIAEVFATYSVDEFHDLLKFDSSDNSDLALAIVMEDGSLLSASKGSSFDIEGVSLFEKLLVVGDNSSAIQQLTAGFNAGERGTVKYSDNSSGKNAEQLICYERLSWEGLDRPWYLVSSISTSVINEQVSQVMFGVYRMMVLIIVLVLAIIAVLGFDGFFSMRRHRKELETMLYVDPLTGGDTALRFKERVVDRGRKCMIVAIDIRSYKTISSICGKAKSESIVLALWDSICKNLEEEEFAGHEDSDRFCLCLYNCDARGVEARLEPLFKATEGLSVELSVPRLMLIAGTCAWGSFDDIDTVYNNAVAAKRELSARADSSDRILDYSQLDLQTFEENHAMESAFKPALAAKEFEAWYQPKYDPRSGVLTGAEALVRWRKPDGALVPPYKFIPLFEGNGMVKELDEYMFRTVCCDLRKWRDEGKAVVPISVNLSRASLYFGDVAQRYDDIAEDFGIDKDLVQVEVTESASDESDTLKNAADDLNSRGFVLHMDDFGTGYSSLSSLGSLEFHTVKLDKTLVDAIGSPDGDKLIKHSMALAKDLGMQITAEGVEEESQMIFLRDLGVDCIQGYYYSCPLPASDFEKLL